MKSEKLIMIKVKGTSLEEEEKNFIQKYQPYGIILFKENIENKEQLKNLTTEILKLHKKCIISVDQEGGRVQRVNLGEKYPPAEYFGKLYEQDGKEKACKVTYESHYKMAKELLDLNINCVLGPVVDLRHSETSDVIGDRSFSCKPQIVIDLAKEVLRAFKDVGVISCIKHAPGHGLAKVDSHKELPIVIDSLEKLKNNDFYIFKELAKDSNIQLCMTAHVNYTALDNALPATISPSIMDYIKNDIGIKGPIVSDDICMGALSKFGSSYSNIAKQFIAKQFWKAGGDIVLCTGEIEDLISIVN